MKVTEPLPEHIYSYGVLGKIKEVAHSPSGNLRIVVEGLCRVKVNTYLETDVTYIVSAETLDEVIDEQESNILMKALMEQYEEYVRVTKKVPAETLISIATLSSLEQLCDTIAGNIPISIAEKQQILEALSVKERIEKMLDLLSKEIELINLEKRINMRVRKQIEKSQKEYWLREQMKAIQRELGDKDDSISEADEFRQKVKEVGLTGEVKEKALKEIDRLEKMPQAAAEAVVVRTYLDWLVSVPWNVLTEDKIDISKAQKVLDEDHYGLNEVKERILEYLAIQKLRQTQGPSCFCKSSRCIKTSLAKSIARARANLSSFFAAASGMAEIRGHQHALYQCFTDVLFEATHGWL